MCLLIPSTPTLPVDKKAAKLQTKIFSLISSMEIV